MGLLFSVSAQLMLVGSPGNWPAEVSSGFEVSKDPVGRSPSLRERITPGGQDSSRLGFE